MLNKQYSFDRISDILFDIDEDSLNFYVIWIKRGNSRKVVPEFDKNGGRKIRVFLLRTEAEKYLTSLKDKKATSTDEYEMTYYSHNVLFEMFDSRKSSGKLSDVNVILSTYSKHSDLYDLVNIWNNFINL